MRRPQGRPGLTTQTEARGFRNKNEANHHQGRAIQKGKTLVTSQSDLKQKCTQLLTSFLGTVFHALSHGLTLLVWTLLLNRRSIDLSGAREKEGRFHCKNFLRASK